MKTTGDYIEELLTSLDDELVELGERLEGLHQIWSKKLRPNALLTFLREMHSGRHLLGSPQFYGRFRAHALEEFVYRLVKKGLPNLATGGIYWNWKVPVHADDENPCGVHADICLGKELPHGYVEPWIVVDCRVELNSAMLLNSAGLATLIKNRQSNCKYYVVYILKDVDDTLLSRGSNNIDGFYQLSKGQREVVRFLETMKGITSSVTLS